MYQVKPNPGGRPKKPNLWKNVEAELRDTVPYMMRMKMSQLKRMMSDDPTAIQKIAYRLISQYPLEIVWRMLPSAWADDFEATDAAIPIELEHIDQAANGINNFNA